MKRLFQLALLPVLAVGIMSCSSDNNGSGKGDGEEVEVKQIEVDSTDLAEAPEVIPTDDTDSTFNDYVENAKITRNISLKFSGNAVTATGDVDAVTITTSGAHVTIKSSCKNVSYSLSGYSNDGSIKTSSNSTAFRSTTHQAQPSTISAASRSISFWPTAQAMPSATARPMCRLLVRT